MESLVPNLVNTAWNGFLATNIILVGLSIGGVLAAILIGLLAFFTREQKPQRKQKLV